MSSLLVLTFVPLGATATFTFIAIAALKVSATYAHGNEEAEETEDEGDEEVDLDTLPQHVVLEAPSGSLELDGCLIQSISAVYK